MPRIRACRQNTPSASATIGSQASALRSNHQLGVVFTTGKIEKPLSEIALHILPPGALRPKMPWQSLMAVRRLPIPRRIPVCSDFLTVDNYQHDSRQQNCRGGDDTLLVIAPYFPKPPHNARRNDKRVGEEAPEKQVYRRPSRLAVKHYRESTNIH